MRHFLIAGAILLLAGCGRDSDPGPITPGPITTASPTIADASFTVRGFVTDTANRFVDQARIEAVDGPQAGAVTLSDARGQFSFGAQRFTQGFTIRASKDGYLIAQQSLIPYSSNNSEVFVSFRIAAPTPPVDLAGDSYSVTITSNPACTALPAAATARTYSATLTRGLIDTVFIGQLRGATFAPPATDFSSYDSFYADVFGRFVRFSFWTAAEEENGIVEQLAPDAFLAIYGTADATVDAGSISLDVPFTGTFAYCAAPRAAGRAFACSTTPAACSSTNHRLTLTRTGSPWD